MKYEVFLVVLYGLYMIFIIKEIKIRYFCFFEFFDFFYDSYFLRVENIIILIFMEKIMKNYIFFIVYIEDFFFLYMIGGLKSVYFLLIFIFLK